MKLLKIIALVILLPFAVMAQDMEDVTISEGMVKMGKKKIPCFCTKYPYEKSLVIDAMENVLDRDGIKRSSRKKGFSIYRGADWAIFSPTKNDYYYKVKSKKGKTTLYFVVSKGYNNYVTLANDPDIAGRVDYFLKKLNGQVFNAIVIKQNEAQLEKIKAKNEAAEKELKAAKKTEAEKAKQIELLKRSDAPSQTR